jgi:hypothetical protein
VRGCILEGGGGWVRGVFECSGAARSSSSSLLSVAALYALPQWPHAVLLARVLFTPHLTSNGLLLLLLLLLCSPHAGEASGRATAPAGAGAWTSQGV